MAGGQTAVRGDEDDLDLLRLRAAAAGDVGAFEQLVRRHSPALYRVALRTTGSPATAEDVVQEAWLAAWRGLGGFRGDSAVRTWLVRIVTTRALNAVRSLDRRPAERLDDAGGDLRDDLPVTPSAAVDAERRAVAAAVRAAVAALPPRQREALVLRDLEGHSYDEVAQALGCSLPTVRSALFRARRALAVALAPWDPTAPRDPALTPGPGPDPQGEP